MFAALLQQLDLLASLVAAREEDDTAESKSLAAQFAAQSAAMSAVFDRLDRLERSQTDRGDREFPDL